MRIQPILLSLIGLASCISYEKDIDRTVIQGTLVIPPQTLDETESTQGTNDDVAAPTEIGFLAWRVVQVSGTCLEFARSTLDGSPQGDLDWYTFSASGDGTISLSFAYPGPGDDIDTGAPPDETISYDVSVYDLGTGSVIAGGSTAGYYGAFDTGFDVVGGGKYAVRVGGLRNQGESEAYALTLGGLDPNTNAFLVGAYEESDPFARSYPVGGTSVSEFTYDASTMTWSGPFEILAIRSHTTNVDTAGVRTDDVNEAIAEVYLLGADFSSLNSSILAGTMYSSTMPSVQLSTDDATTDLHEGAIVTIDNVQPIQYGWTFEETEPNDVEPGSNDTNYLLTGDLSVANVTDVATGLGYVDIIKGSLAYEVDDPSWGSDNDVFAVTMPADLVGTIKLDWSDAAYDLDLVIYDADGVSVAFSAYSDYPEVATLSDWGVVLSAGATYYVQVLGWGGAAGEQAYTVSMEWAAP